MLAISFSVIFGACGLLIAVCNLARPQHLYAAVILLISAIILIIRDGDAGFLLVVKMATMYGCFVVSRLKPALMLGLAAAFFLIDGTVGILLNGLTKLSPLPSIAILLTALYIKKYSNAASHLLILIFALFAITNFFILSYRTEFVYLALAVISYCALKLKLPKLAFLTIFLPPAIALIYFVIGAQFSNDASFAVIAGFEVQGTASNFERSVFSYFTFSQLAQYPLGQSLEVSARGLNNLATVVGRAFYSDDLLDPHNFLLFFALQLGIIGLLISFLVLISVYRRCFSLTPEEPVFLALILALASTTISLFPFSTEPRFIVAVSLGVLFSFNSIALKKNQASE